MNLADFPEPPAELIAQEPLAERDAARLMVLDRAERSIGHKIFRELPSLFRAGDVLVLNDVRVFPARLTAVKPTGGKVKLLLLEKGGDGSRWTSLLTPAQKAGTRLRLAAGLDAVVDLKRDSGEYELSFSRPLSEADVERLGRMPLPPYIRRGEADRPEVEARDREFYQTVFSSPDRPAAPGGAFAAPGAVAAPTAGLHFTPALLERLSALGVEVRRLRLDVGWGTFRPIRSEDYKTHQMMAESYVVPGETADAVNRAKAEKRRVWAVGTTAVRTLEAAGADGKVAAGPGAASLYIYPGYRFRVVDALVTNFHLRDHTPLLLAAAFSGADFLRESYAQAVKAGYRFLSYGDGMAIL